MSGEPPSNRVLAAGGREHDRRTVVVAGLGRIRGGRGVQRATPRDPTSARSRPPSPASPLGTPRSQPRPLNITTPPTPSRQRRHNPGYLTPNPTQLAITNQ